MAWDPDRYRRFAAERAQPFHDLLDLVESAQGPGHGPGHGPGPGPGPSAGLERAVDLGCGSGELTLLAAGRFGVTEMVGIDDDAAMLDAASSLARSDGSVDPADRVDRVAPAAAAGQEHPDRAGRPAPSVRFERGDIARWTGDADHDLVLANASLQWVPDHPGVLARWAAALRPGGCLAVQVPANADHPSHLASAHVAGTAPFLGAMGGDPPPDPVAANVLAPERYATLLHELGLVDVHVRLQVYGHVLESSADVVEWTRGTSLTRFFARLPDDLHEPFVDAYRSELLSRIGDHQPYFYPFKRILLRACSPGPRRR